MLAQESLSPAHCAGRLNGYKQVLKDTSPSSKASVDVCVESAATRAHTFQPENFELETVYLQYRRKPEYRLRRRLSAPVGWVTLVVRPLSA